MGQPWLKRRRSVCYFNNPPVYLVPSGSIGDDENCVFLGNSLGEVLSKTSNVEDELDILYPKHQSSGNKEKLIELKLKLIAIKENRDSGELNLKDFIIAKRQIEEEIKTIENNS